VDLLHDRIPFGIVGERAGRPQNAFAPFPGGLNDPQMDLDLLDLGHTEVLVEFDGLAADLVVNRFGHGRSLLTRQSRNRS
jgi:hypothetical protein